MGNAVVKYAGYAIGAVVGVAASCGLSQIYGLVKGAVTLIRLAACRAQINKVHKEIEKLLTASSIESAQDELAIATTLEEMLNKKISLLNKDLGYAGKALIPLVGAIWVSHSKKYELGSLSIISSILEEIIPESLASRTLFYGVPAKMLAQYDFLLEELEPVMKKMGGTYVKIPVSEGHDCKKREIEGIFVPGVGCTPSDPTIVVYGGNAQTCILNLKIAYQFRHAGYNVLLTTPGGKQYPSSHKCMGNDFYTSELSLYADVDGEMAWLKNRGVKEVGIYGWSLGGTKAMQAAVKYGDGISKKEDFPSVKFVIADRTFTSANDVASNVANNICGAKSLGRMIGRSAAPIGKTDGVNIADGLNNCRKAKMLRGSKVHMMTIEATEDIMMGRKKRRGIFYNNFSLDILKARYGTIPSNERVIIQGGHEASLDNKVFLKIAAFAKRSC